METSGSLIPSWTHQTPPFNNTHKHHTNTYTQAHSYTLTHMHTHIYTATHTETLSCAGTHADTHVRTGPIRPLSMDGLKCVLLLSLHMRCLEIASKTGNTPGLLQDVLGTSHPVPLTLSRLSFASRVRHLSVSLSVT